MPLLGFTKL